MSSPQLHPLLLDPKTGEPYLRLPSPHDNIIITPPRLTDAPAILRNMTDPAVYTMLSGPPFPYLPSHADHWLNIIKTECDNVLRELLAGEQAPGGQLITVGVSPVRILREVQEEGTQLLIGDLGILRCPHGDVVDEHVRDVICKENQDRQVGDPDIVWCIGSVSILCLNGAVTDFYQTTFRHLITAKGS